MKKCPYCAKDVPDEDTYCPHCWRDISTEPTSIAPAEIQGSAPMVTAVQSAPARMTLLNVLFSADGRIPRSTYWYYNLAMLGVYIVAILADLFLELNTDYSLHGIMSIGPISGIFLLFFVITTIFVNIKRCHDLDWTGWFELLAFVPIASIIVGIYWAFIKGTAGPNKYGPDPTYHPALVR